MCVEYSSLIAVTTDALREVQEGTTAAGRPIGSEYYDPERKLAFMDMHGIEISVLR